MTHAEIVGDYIARPSGSVGHEILNPSGDIIGWTVDGYWAAVIVALLNGAEGCGPGLPCPASREAKTEPDCRASTVGNGEAETVRRAIA